jgi:hypothetical protein
MMNGKNAPTKTVEKSSPALATVQAQLDAYNARDIEAFAATYADDAQLIELATGKVFCSGKNALRQRYGEMFAQYPELRCHLTNRIVCGDFVFDDESVTGRVPGKTAHAVLIYEVKEGLISRAWMVREE